MSRVPEEILKRCKADPVFRTAVVLQMQKAIEEARFVGERLSEDLARINAACAIEIAQPGK